MRILAAADIHGQWPVYEWLLASAQQERVGAIVLAGDLLGFPDEFDSIEEAQQHQAPLVADFLDSAGTPVLYLMGNDDLVELRPRTDAVQSLHGKRVLLGGFAFAGYQYCLPFTGRVFEKLEAGIEADLANLAQHVDAGTVFVSHSPAFGILDIGWAKTPVGSRALLRFLDANGFRAHIHGHCHSGFGRYENHFNVAAAGQRRAMIIDLETLGHRIIGNSPG